MFFPKNENPFPLSITESPVTQVADVDVKRASIKLMFCFDAIGSESSTVPDIIRQK